MTKLVRLVLPLIVVGMLVAACGGDSSSDTTTGAPIGSESGDDRGSDTVPSGDRSTTTKLDRMVCHVPEPTPISLGEAVTGEVLGWDECFTVDVPAGAATLTIELTGLQDQLNLTAGYADPETILYNIGDFWSSREDGLADETIVIESPEPGTYYVNVAVATYRNQSPFTLTTSTS